MIKQPRIVSRGARGPDIVAYKGGLVHAGARDRGLSRSPLFGQRMWHEVHFFQRQHGLQADGVIGPNTYHALYPFMGSYARAYLKRANDRWRSRSVQERYVSNALWSTQTRLYGSWVYAEVRPIPYWIPPHTVGEHTAVTDCSGFAGLMAKWSGAPSPFGPLGYSGAGNTDTMVEYCKPVSFPGPGDLVLYDNPGHVVIVTRYPFAVSFGSEPGPIHIDSRYRAASHFRRFL